MPQMVEISEQLQIIALEDVTERIVEQNVDDKFDV